MIQSKTDYIEYLERDRIALEVNNDSLISRIKNLLSRIQYGIFKNECVKLEYYTNCKNRGHIQSYI